MADEERQRRRMLGRLQTYLARRRSPRAVLSAIMVLTAMSGFLMSVGMLKLGVGAMWLRYPLAVLGAWVVFLVLVRSWAERERAAVRVDDDLASPGPRDDVYDGSGGRGVLMDGARRRRGWDWLDWLDLLGSADDLAGCLVGLAVVAAIIAFAGALVAIAGLIMQAEILLAEVLLDVLLVSALNKRLHKLEPQWWLAGTVRQTVGPVLAAMAFLAAAGYLMQWYAPEAESIGAVWRQWRGVR